MKCTVDMTEYFPMKVRSTADVRKLASAIYFNLQQKGKIALVTVGAGPTQQAMKAVSVSNLRFIENKSSKRVTCTPYMHDVMGNEGTKVTAMSILCEVVELPQ